MLLTLTKPQMLQLWRQKAGLEPTAAECSVTRFDGINIDALIEPAMRQWYLNLLDTAPPTLIGYPQQAAHLVELIPPSHSSQAIATLSIHPSVRRLCSVRLSHWNRAALVAHRSIVAAWVELQDNPYAAAAPQNPIAWRHDSGLIFVSPVSQSSQITSAMAYTDPGPDTYIFDESAIATIPTSFALL